MPPAVAHPGRPRALACARAARGPMAPARAAAAPPGRRPRRRGRRRSLRRPRSTPPAGAARPAAARCRRRVVGASAPRLTRGAPRRRGPRWPCPVRERVGRALRRRDRGRIGRADAGVGPTHAGLRRRRLPVRHRRAGGALLVYHLRPELHADPPLPAARRARTAIAIDDRRQRMWVTLTARNQLAELIAAAGRRSCDASPSVGSRTPSPWTRRRARVRRGRATACFSSSSRGGAR